MTIGRATIGIVKFCPCLRIMGIGGSIRAMWRGKQWWGTSVHTDLSSGFLLWAGSVSWVPVGGRRALGALGVHLPVQLHLKSSSLCTSRLPQTATKTPVMGTAGRVASKVNFQWEQECGRTPGDTDCWTLIMVPSSRRYLYLLLQAVVVETTAPVSPSRVSEYPCAFHGVVHHPNFFFLAYN